MVNIEHFRIGKYKFTLEIRDNLFMPPYKGSTLRGGFGSVFKEIVCFQKKGKDCSSCLLCGNCPYYYIFETTTPPTPQIMSEDVAAPRPFVLEPPLEEKENYKPRENISFHLILIGKGNDYLPYFIAVFNELGKEGMGLNRGQYDLINVDYIDPLTGKTKQIFNPELDKFVDEINYITGKDIVSYFDSNPTDLTLYFLTPARVKYQGSFIKTPEMHVLLRNLLRRLNLLSYFHHNEQPLIYKMEEIADIAENIHIVEENITWYDWHRFSKRQKNRMDFGGFLGEVKYRGPIKQFLPILFLGSLVHIGKNTTFGLGKMVLEFTDSGGL